jgi:hypothetical protein
MAWITLYSCDFDGCLRALDDNDVSQIQVQVRQPGGLDDLPGTDQVVILDLCREHLDVVLGRVLSSTLA